MWFFSKIDIHAGVLIAITASVQNPLGAERA